MARLITESKINCGDVRSLNISTPPLASQNYNREDTNTYCNQGFVWHPNFVGFETRGEIGGGWVRVYVSNNLELEAEIERAIVVPYFVSSENYFYLSDDDSGQCVELESSQYQLLYQNRYLRNDEIEILGEFEDEFEPEEDPDSFRPELCLLTFIPTTEEIEPQILRHEPGFNPPSELIMFSEPMPQH